MSTPTITSRLTDVDTDAVLPPALLAVVSLLAAALANNPQPWVDEVITINLVTRWNYWELLTVLPQRQPHLPTYYLFLKTVGFTAGQLVSVLCYPLTALATVELADSTGLRRDRAWIAGYLVAVSPFLAIQASWLRMYSPLTALLTVGLWQTIKGHYPRAAIPFVLAVLLHPFAVLPMGWYLLQVHEDRREVVPARQLAATVVPIAVLLAFKYQKGGLGFSDYSTGVTHGIMPGWRELAVLPLSSLLGGVYTSGMFLLAVIATVLVFYPLGDRRLLAWIAIPIVGVTLASYLLHPVFRPKYFGFIAPAVAVLAARPRESWTHEYLVWISLATLYLSMWTFRAFDLILTRYYRFLF